MRDPEDGEGLRVDKAGGAGFAQCFVCRDYNPVRKATGNEGMVRNCRTFERSRECIVLMVTTVLAMNAEEGRTSLQKNKLCLDMGNGSAVVCQSA